MVDTDSRIIPTEDRMFSRDVYSKALLSTDAQALARHRLRRAKARESESLTQQIADVQARCQLLEKQVSELYLLLHHLQR